jgi:class 3 adenylate cyclase
VIERVVDRIAKSLDEADDVVEQPGLRQEVVRFGDVTIGRTIHAPGWRWSSDVRPFVGTDRCQVRHLGYAISGVVAIETEDGRTVEVHGGSAFDIPPGHDSWVVGDEPYVTLEWTGVGEWLLPAADERILGTLLFTDIVDSTGHVVRRGDRAWRKLLAAHDEAFRDLLIRARAREVKATGDGYLALFDGPARAINTAILFRARVRTMGLELRQAVHVGEVELAGSDVRGVAVHEAARMMALAGPGEILASSTTRLLAGGAGVRFEERGRHEIRGLEGAHELFAVVVDG